MNLKKSFMLQKKWKNYHDSRGGTDTPGPGESVSAIRFNGKFYFSRKKLKKRNFEKFRFFTRFLFLLFIFAGGYLEYPVDNCAHQLVPIVICNAIADGSQERNIGDGAHDVSC